MIFKPHLKQLEFLNDDRPRILYSGGLPYRGSMKFELNPSSKESYERIANEGAEMENKLSGVIKMINMEKSFGFIKGKNGTEYFFHRSGYQGHWIDLTEDYILYQNGKRDPIIVEFEPVDADKGPRAESIIRKDDGRI